MDKVVDQVTAALRINKYTVVNICKDKKKKVDEGGSLITHPKKY